MVMQKEIYPHEKLFPNSTMSDSQTQPDAAHHEHVLPPVRTNLTNSSQTLALSGNSLFIVNTTYECTRHRPNWTLIRVFAHLATGIRICDTEPLLDGSGNVIKYRRLGPDLTRIGDQDDEGNIDLDDTELVRLALGEQFSTSYTIRHGGEVKQIGRRRY
jgi:hypothetical protein